MKITDLLKTKLSEETIKQIGFKKEKEYEHDQFTTCRYVKDNLEVEFTYEKNKLVSQDVTIKEINCMPISYIELIELDLILNE